MYADDTQVYGFCSPGAAAELQEQLSLVHRRHRCMDAVKQTATQHCEDRSPLVCFQPATASASAGQHCGVGVDNVYAPRHQSRDLGIYLGQPTPP
jgi:hypothetical protein